MSQNLSSAAVVIGALRVNSQMYSPIQFHHTKFIFIRYNQYASQYSPIQFHNTKFVFIHYNQYASHLLLKELYSTDNLSLTSSLKWINSFFKCLYSISL